MEADKHMGRRGRNNGAEDLIERVGRLPWWVGVALAAVSYFILHAVAGQLRAPVAANQLGVTIAHSVWRGFATVGQYVIPLICLAGAAVSALSRRQRQNLVQNTAKSESADALNGMSWQQFEQLVGEAFRQQGYAAAEAGGGGADGGVDLVLTRSGEKFFVQCKQWRAFKVGVEVVRELYGVMAARGAAGGFVVTSGRYTSEATAFASGRNVKLIDGPQLHQMLRLAQAAAAASHQSRRETAPQPAAHPDNSVPLCPTCGKSMVRRVARQGSNAGSDFWGCSAFPRCRGTRPAV
jgi:restriction system protein